MQNGRVRNTTNHIYIPFISWSYHNDREELSYRNNISHYLNSKGDIKILSDHDILNVFDALMLIWSTFGAIAASALAVAGLGKPTSITGAALVAGSALEASTAFYLGGGGSSSTGGNMTNVYIEQQHDSVQI